MEIPGKSRPRLMTTDEVAKYLRISKASVYRLVKNKQIPVGKVGRQLRFRKDVVDNWLSMKEHEHIAPSPKKDIVLGKKVEKET